MNEAEQNAYFHQRLLEIATPLACEAMDILGHDRADEHAAVVLVDMCLRSYNAGVRDGAAEAAAQAVEQGAQLGTFTMGVTIPDGPLGTG